MNSFVKSDETLQVKKKVNELFLKHEYDDIKPYLLSHKSITEHDNELAMVCYLCTIYEQEKEEGQLTLFSKVSDIDSLLKRYTMLKFYLRRIDFDVLDDIEPFYQFISLNQVSSYELLRTIDFSVVHRDKVLKIMSAGIGSRADAEMECQDSNKCYDTTEVCFIICTNNQIYAQECIHYINHLNVPKGVGIEILTVEEAKSLAGAYNEAMQHSHAKYKVYLHHDTFIIHRNFIVDCLELFQSNLEIGMIGNVGVPVMPSTGVMWDTDRYGMLYEQHIYETELLANAIPTQQEYMKVEAIDGFIMVTQYDIPWREDLFDKWDFYDCSQSMEFIRNGYQVVVPDMKEPWCIHDCGFINLSNYDEERRKFVQEYLKGRV